MFRYRLLPVLILFGLLAMLYAIPAYGAADEYLADLDSTKQNGDTHASPFFPSTSPVTLKTSGLQPPGNCEVGLDIYYVLDISSSMEQGYPGSANKLEAAKEAIVEVNGWVESWDNGSRVALLPFYATNPSNGTTAGVTVDPHVLLTEDFDAFAGYLNLLNPIGFTPTAQAMRAAAEWMVTDTEGSLNLPVMILLSDGVPSVSYDPDTFPDPMSQGYAYEQDEVDDTNIRNGTGGFLSIIQVRPLGRLMPYGTYTAPEDGQVYDYTTAKPLADTMAATQYALTQPELADLTIHAIGLQGSGPLSNFNDGILEYVATEGNGVYASPTNFEALQDALEDAVQESSGCLPPPLICENTGLDVYFVVDASQSMAQIFEGTVTKIDAAKMVISETVDYVANWNNGTQVGLIAYFGGSEILGGEGMDYNPFIPLTTDYEAISDSFEFLQPSGSTPTAHGLRFGAVNLIEAQLTSNNKPIIILLTDGVPTMSYEGVDYFGYNFIDSDVQDVTIKDNSGGFLPGIVVRQSGITETYGGYGINGDGQYEYPQGVFYAYSAGKPLADTMDATLYALTNPDLEDLNIHAIALQGTSTTFSEDILQYVAVYGNGVFASPDDLAALQTALLEAVQTSGDCPPLPIDQSWSQGECPFCGNDERQRFEGPINTFSGNYNYTTSDISVATLGTPLRFDRSYNSSPIEGGVVYSLPLGYGWTHNYNVRLVRPQDSGGEPDTIILQGPRGSRMRFADNGGGSYSAYPGIWSEMVSGLVSGNTVYTVTAANQELFIFNANGQLTRHEDPQGNQREFSYTSGLLTEVLDPETERDLTIAYDGEERITSVTDHTGRKVEYGYDGNGDLIVFTDTRELTWDYAYTDHRLIEIEDPENDILERIEYDSAGRARTVTDGEERVMAEIEYEPEGSGFTLEPTRVITQQGTVYTATYNSRNLIASVELADGQETVYGHDYHFNTSQTYDGLQNPTVYERNPFGQPLTVTDALDHETFYEYDSLNHLTALTRTITDGQVMTTTYTYHPTNNRMTRMTDALGHTTIYTYNAVGDLIEMEDPLGRVSSYGYDEYGNLTQTVDALLNVTTFEYDELGRVITTTDALSMVTVNDYDMAGNVISVTQNYTVGNIQNLSNTYNLITFYAYDGVGRQTYSTDTLGMVMRYEYDDSGLLITATVNYTSNSSALATTYNLKTVYGYDEHGRQSTVKDPLGYISYTGYDEQGRVACVIVNYSGTAGCTTVYNPAFSDRNLITRYAYDAAGNRTHVTDPLGRITFTTYDALNRTASVTQNYTTTTNTDPDLNLTTVYTYNDVGNVVLMSDPLGRVTLTEYDERQQPITITLNYTTTSYENRTDISVTTVYTYDAVGNRTVMTDAEGRPTEYKYDKLNRVEVITDALEGLTFYQYDEVGNQVVMTDAEGRATFTEYDSLYRPLTVTRNFITNTAATTDTNITTTYTYDARGNRVTQTDALGRVVLWEYDSLGRVITTTVNAESIVFPGEPDVNIRTVVEYDALSRRVGMTDPRNYTTTYAYDGVGRLITTTNFLEHETVFAYDGLGNRLGITNAEGEVTAFGYDRLNRLVVTTATIEVGEVMTTGTTYDKAGNRLSLRDGEGVVTCYGYDLMDRLTRVTENCLAGQTPTHEVNVRSEYGYDSIGNRVVFTNARNYPTTYEYDTLNRLITETDALDHITRYEYNAVGNRTVMTDAEGQITEFAYDGVYRVDGIDYSNSTIATADVAFDYDALGNRLVMTDGTGVTTYGYDRANRLIVTTNGAEQSVEYTYDVMGNRLSLSNAFYNLAYYYDQLHRLQTVEIGGADQFNYSYDDAGRLTTLTYPNGVVSSYDYDEAGRLIALSHSANSTPIADYEYTFDKANNRTVISETIPTYVAPTRAITYTYDPLYRLTEAEYATGEFYTYTYDATGNRESFLFDNGVVATTEYTYNAVNWLIEVNNVQYDYDLNGNLIADDTNAYFYDGANRLTQVTGSVNPMYYTYDGLGNRVEQSVNAQSTPYTLDIAGGLPEVLVAGETGYIQVGGQLLAQSDGTGKWHYIQPDHLGSVRQLSNADGTIIAYNEYDPFGNPVTTSGAESAFGYTGEQEDESGLLFLRARYYDAQTGRFLSHDPFAGTLEQPYSQHPYQYGYSNPVRYTDPSGQCADLRLLAPQSFGEFRDQLHPAYLNSAQSYIDRATDATQIWEECQNHWRAAFREMGEGNIGGAALLATGLRAPTLETVDFYFGVHDSLLTTYNPNTEWYERLLPATNVTLFALSFAPAPGAGGVSSFYDDVARGGRQVLNSVSSCADDALRWLSGRGSSLSSRSSLLTGVARYDRLAIETAEYAGWKANMEARGYIVREGPIPWYRNAKAQVVKEGEQIVILIDPQVTTYIDLLHESRHIRQIEKAIASGLLDGRDPFNRWFEPFWERGAYTYELRVGQGVGFSNEYMNSIQNTMDSIWMNRKIQYKWSESPYYRTLLDILWH